MRGVLGGLLAAFLPVALAAGSGANVRRLTLDAPVEAELSPGRTDAYAVTLRAGEFLHIAVEQNHVDAAVRLLDAHGTEIAAADNSADEDDPITLSVVAASGGDHRIEIRFRTPKPGPGRYRLVADPPRRATPQDEERIIAERRRSKGDALLAEATAETSHEAVATYEKTLPLWREICDSREEAATLDRITDTLGWLGDLRSALERAQEALAIWRDLGDRRGEASALDEVGVALIRTGDPRRAMETLQESLALRREDGNLRGIAETTNNLGSALSATGDYPAAVARYGEAVEYAHAWGDPAIEATMRKNHGVNLSVLGELDRAKSELEDALAEFRRLGDRHQEGVTLYSLGVVYLDRRDPAEALRTYRLARPLLQETGDKNAESAVVSHMGLAELAENNPKEALDLFETARAMQHTVGDRRHEASAISCIARARLEMGDAAAARDGLHEALAMIRATADRGTEAIALVNLARADQMLGDLDAARRDVEDALRFTESTRGSIPALGERALYLAATHDRYDLLIDILMDLDAREPGKGWSAEALHASERAKARSLVDFLASARIDLREGVDPDLLEREKSLESQIEARRREAERRLSDPRIPVPEGSSLDALLAQYDEVLGRLRAADPRFAALARPQPLTEKQIEASVDRGTVLLEYALGTRRSFVWAVTSGGVTSHVLPPRESLESAARRFVAACAAGSSETPTAAAAARRLGRMILGPVDAEIRGRRIAVVSEGALLYVPFAALPDRQGRALVERHEIVSLPSATTLAILRRESAQRGSPELRAAVLADPVFDGRDPRVTDRKGFVRAALASPGSEELTRSMQDAGLRLERLSATRREAEAIGALAGARRSLVALDFSANRSTAMGPEVARAGIVHFASHALLDSVHPDLSGIILSLVDARGRPIDGFLEARDVYSLRLSANLVVLSACQTALGRDVRGEGLLGLARGFMYAGAPRIVASLWKVPDRATAELMRQFYEGVIGKHRPPAAALRAAQDAMHRTHLWSSPYYWAAFTLQGDWN